MLKCHCSCDNWRIGTGAIGTPKSENRHSFIESRFFWSVLGPAVPGADIVDKDSRSARGAHELFTFVFNLTALPVGRLA